VEAWSFTEDPRAWNRRAAGAPQRYRTVARREVTIRRYSWFLVPIAAAAFLAFEFARPIEENLREFDRRVGTLSSEQARLPPEHDGVARVQADLRNMVDEDGYARMFANIPQVERYGALRYWYFWLRFRPRAAEIENRHLAELKRLLARYGWIRRSRFGAEADENAWLIAHHADTDRPFQKQVLARLKEEAAKGETAPEHYARLYDRVAFHEQRPQRYGTQGHCLGPGRWEPRPIEDPVGLDARRRAMGLPSMRVQRSTSASRCRYADRD
jgi:hypothetical protein